MAAFCVEIELKSAAYDSAAGLVNASLEYRLINEATQAVLARKTVSLVLPDSMGAFDVADIAEAKSNEALAWAQFLVSAQKLSQMVGGKVRHSI